MQKPSLARMVIARVDPAMNNGATEAPAVITRVWSEQLDHWIVNVRVFLDGSNTAPLALTSIRLYKTEPVHIASDTAHCAWWPPRV